MTTVKHFMKTFVSVSPEPWEVVEVCASILGKKRDEVESMKAGECLKIWRDAFEAFGEDIGGSVKHDVVHLGRHIDTIDSKVEFLEFKQPTMKHVRDFPLSKPSYGDYIHLTSELTGIPTTFLKNMHLADMRNVMSVISHFLRSGS